MEGVNVNELKHNYVNEYVAQVFLHLFLGLFLTGVVSFLSFKSGLTLWLAQFGIWAFLIIGIFAFILVLAQSFLAKNIAISALLYYLFSIVEGVSISPIFYAYTGSDISLAFVITSLLFLGLYFIAKSNVVNLRKMGTILLVALIVGVIGSLINLFLKNSLVDLIITWFLIFVFMGLTIYDLQTLEELAETRNPFFGALSLYLDIINLFLLILKVIGNDEE